MRRMQEEKVHFVTSYQKDMMKPAVSAHAYNLNTQETEAEGWKIEAYLDYTVRSCSLNKQISRYNG
jgi:hypothetical protein